MSSYKDYKHTCSDNIRAATKLLSCVPESQVVHLFRRDKTEGINYLGANTFNDYLENFFHIIGGSSEERRLD